LGWHWSWYASARIRGDDLPGAIAHARKVWQKYSANYPFDYFFLDDEFNRMYKAEEKLSEIFGYFTFLAIFIACLGLFGLASFTAERKTKEIGIRRVLGASVANIVNLISKEFVTLILVANFIAWPIAYFAMNKWLQNFAYRIDIGWWMFALTGGLALLIAFLTVSTQALKAALANPVEALRYE
jgi:putative ABC transport system permease protein